MTKWKQSQEVVEQNVEWLDALTLFGQILHAQRKNERERDLPLLMAQKLHRNNN